MNRSLHIESNGLLDVCRDKAGVPLEGTVVREDGVIRRFRQGLLDGDTVTPGGKRITRPAVEAPGHMEYWRGGALHRDGGLPAVVTGGFTVREWWENGLRIEGGGK